MKRWHARTEQLLGKEAYSLLSSARVAVFGLGGVGSYACETLARAGVGSLYLVDHDVVNPTNLNRQILALRSTVGLPKADVAKARVLDINPDCDVDARKAFINNDSYEELLGQRIDLLIDAIDSVNAKVGLLEAALSRGIPVVSSMGCGGRSDGSLIQIADISETNNCPLARVVRLRLGRRGIRKGIRCVFSTETCQNSLPHEPEDVDAHLVPSRQRTPLGTISYMPGLFGLRVAEEAIRLLLSGKDFRS